MKSLAPYFTTFARVSNRLHLKTTRARLLAFVALIALFSTIAVSASSAGSLRQLFASKRAEAQTTKAGGPRASLARQRLTLSAAQSVTRQGQTTTTLKDGRILTTGGRDINGLVVSSVEIFDPANNTFTSFGSLVQARVDHTASLLSDGRVLIAGGSDGANALRSTEIFDPASGFSVSGPQMSAARSGHAANVVHNGDFVLIVGSDGSGEMFNARTGSFSGPSSKSGIGSSISSSSKLSVQTNESQGGATITTDREDYPPYSTVVISGSGFTPGETVSLVVEQIAPAQATYEPWTTVADENGNILTSWFVFSDELVGATLQATATGQTSGLTASATFTDALAAGVALNGDTNGFNIDGSLRAVTTASPSPTALRTDWLDRLTPTPATGGIVNEDGSPRTPASGPVYLASDPFGNGSSDDVFSGSVKADQNPNTMTWDSTGNNQGKTDLNRVYVHISHDSINDAWVTASADRGSTSGAAYVDFELNQVPVIKNANGTFSSAGPNGGRTANDMLITAQYGGNGTPTLNLFKWELVSGSYVWVDHSNDANIQGKAFAASNSGTLGLPYTSFGSSSYTAGQFVEMSVNVSALVAAGNPCAGIGISTVWVRTKTANSTSANMADFASPISVSFNAGFTATASASPNTYPGTINTSVTGGTGTKSYALTGAGDPQPVTFPNSTGTFTNLAPGSYKVWVKDSPGCVAGSNTVTIVARPITITADNRSKAYGTSLPLGTSGFSVTSGSLNSGDTISAVTLTSTGGLAGSTSAAAGTYVGNIVPSGASGSGNFPAYYNVSYANGDLSITQATASCNVTPYDVPYDGTQKTASGSCTGLSGTVNLTSGLNLTNTQHTNAANYPTDSWSFHDAAGNFADISATTITDNISKVAVTATAGSYGPAPYDGSAHALSACVVTGFAGLSCTNNPTGPVGPDVGSGTVTPDTSSISTTNFTITPVNGNWSITQVAVTATAGSYSGVYDGNTHALSACAVTGYAGLSCTNSPTGPVGPNVGSGVVTPDTSGISTTNFIITPVNGNWSITQVAVTATAGSYSGVYDGNTHALSACAVTGYAGLTCTNSPTGPVGPNVGSGAVTPDTSSISTTNFIITPVNGSWSITQANVTATAGGGSSIYDNATHSPSACQVTGAYTGTLTCSNNPSSVGPGVGTTPIIPVPGGDTLSNFNITPVNGSYSITQAPTQITFGGPTSNQDFLCGAQGTYTATLKDTYNNVPLSGISLTLTIGSQTASGTTNGSGVATFSLVLNQAPGSPGETVGLTNAWTDPNRSAPLTQSGPFTVLPDSNVGPGANSGALYTGPAFSWTTSPTSSTTTLTLNATIKDTSEQCAGDITKAKVSFFISSNNGSSFSPVSNAQNLPVGLVNPLDKTVGTASTTSQYNIGSNKAVTLIVRVVVGGLYVYNAADYDVPVVVAVPGQPNTLTAAGTLTNTAATGVTGTAFPVAGANYFADGYLGYGNGTTGGGLAAGSASFGGFVQCNNSKCTNPQGQLNANLSSYNKPDGTNDYPHVHHYFMKTNAISGWGTTSIGSGFFSAKTNLFETTGGASNGLDGGGMMQMIFANKGATYTYQSTTNNKTSVTLTCPMSATNGCASIIIYRSNGLGGGVWFSSAWGPVAASDLPQTIMKTLTGGTIAYAGAGGTLGAPVQGAPTTGSALGSGDESITPVPTASTTTTSNVASTTNFVGAVVTSGYTPTTNVQPSNNVVTNANSARRLFIGRADSDSRDREIAFAADGLVGKNWVLSNFENSVESITNGVTPDGQITVTVRTCNRPDGTRDMRCVATKPSTQHVYVFETNVLAEASLVADIANLNATAVVYELLANGEKKTLDKDVAMQIVFVPENQMLPLTIGAAGGSACTDKAGCAAIAVRKADGSLWYSGGWRLTGREQ